MVVGASPDLNLALGQMQGCMHRLLVFLFTPNMRPMAKLGFLVIPYPLWPKQPSAIHARGIFPYSFN